MINNEFRLERNTQNDQLTVLEGINLEADTTKEVEVDENRSDHSSMDVGVFYLQIYFQYNNNFFLIYRF